MMALNRYRLNHLVRKGNKSAKLTAKLLGHTDRLLGSILFGSTLLNVALATLAEIIAQRLFGSGNTVILLGTLVTTFVVLLFAEIMPKVIAASQPERIALLSSYPLAMLIRIFHPVVLVATPPPMLMDPGKVFVINNRFDGIGTVGVTACVVMARPNPSVTTLSSVGEKTRVSCNPTNW